MIINISGNQDSSPNRKIFGATNKLHEGGGEQEIARESFVFQHVTLGKIWCIRH